MVPAYMLLPLILKSVYGRGVLCEEIRGMKVYLEHEAKSHYYNRRGR